MATSAPGILKFLFCQIYIEKLFISKQKFILSNIFLFTDFYKI